jgi:hypothetical protein
VLRSFAPKLGTNCFLDSFSGDDDSFDVLEIGAAASSLPSPRFLPQAAELSIRHNARVRRAV